MINLLPPVQQKEIRAAATNVLLLRYTLLLVGAVLFLLAAFAITYLSLSQGIQQADEAKQKNEQEAVGYSQTQAVANKFRTDLTAAKTLFETETLYSKVLVRFSSLLPDGTALESFEVDAQTLTQPKTVQIQVRNREAAEALRRNFEQSPYVTSSALKGIATDPSSRAYPYIASLEFTLDRSIGQ